MTRRVCVIGAGASGLTAIKACLEEGLSVDCYEKSDNIGGLWRFREEDLVGASSVMKSTIINSSKEMSAYTDFPPDAKYANFMHNTCVLEYLENYAEHFKLKPHIHLNHEIMKLEKNKDYDDTGCWNVKVKKAEDGVIKEHVYDAVMIATGHYTYPHWPNFRGMDSFKGHKIHSQSYKDHRGYEDKTVLVVGLGNSGIDVAVELARVAKQVYLSSRRGAWIISRAGANGIPFDLLYSSRFYNNLFGRVLPWHLANLFFEKLASYRMDHELYCLKPKHRFFSQHATVGDDLPYAILAGIIKVCNDVEQFTETSVVFKGDDEQYGIDAVIYATGYEFQLPFVDKEILEVKNNETDLYRLVFPPHLKHPTLAVIGFVQPRGAIFPTSEMQARWTAMVFTKQLSLPSVGEMIEEINARRQAVKSFMVDTQRYRVDCDFAAYNNEMASLIGAKLNFWKLALKDPKLFWACLFGPFVPYQFRLQGPHKWSGAREAILTVSDRVKYPLKTRDHEISSMFCKNISRFTKMIIFLVVVFAIGIKLF